LDGKRNWVFNLITFKPIKTSDYEIVRQMDNLSFKKGNSFRSVENIANLALINPDGCLLCLKDDKPVGFVFSRVFGSIGYLGPLGVYPEQQNCGYGKLIVQEGIKYLKNQNCRVIGLETLHEWGKNIGLYHKLGFRATLPARIMEKTIPTKVYGKLSPALCLGNDISKGDRDKLLQDIMDWTPAIYPGLNLSQDIQRFLMHYPERILFVVEQDKVSGFFAFHPEFTRYGWGAMKPTAEDGEHFKNLLNAVEGLGWGPNLAFRFHTHFYRLTDLFFECGYQLICDTTCMLLDGKSDHYHETNNSILIRAWVG
jgi:predicted N-acetyltransferase YhbS